MYVSGYLMKLHILFAHNCKFDSSAIINLLIRFLSVCLKKGFEYPPFVPSFTSQWTDFILISSTVIDVTWPIFQIVLFIMLDLYVGWKVSCIVGKQDLCCFFLRCMCINKIHVEGGLNFVLHNYEGNWKWRFCQSGLPKLNYFASEVCKVASEEDS